MASAEVGYDDAVDLIDGTGCFFGPRLPAYEVSFVEHAPDPSAASWPLAYREAIASLTVDELLPYLAESPIPSPTS